MPTDDTQDLIWITEAEAKYGKSRWWFERHFETVTLFGDRHKYLRRSELEARLGKPMPADSSEREA